MKVTFTGVPGEKHDSVHMYGQDFPLNKAVDVTNPMAMRKLANHPHFKAEATPEDHKLDEQVRRDVMAAATAGLADAQKEAQLRPHGPTAMAPAPTLAPVEPNLRPLRSALEYQQVVEGAGPGTNLQEVLRPEEQAEPRQTADTTDKAQRKETGHGAADHQRAGAEGAAQTAGAGSPRAGETGRSGKGR